MAKQVFSKPALEKPAPARPAKPSSLLDTRVIYCGDNLEQLAKLPDACVDWANQLHLRGCSALLFIHDLDRHKPKRLRSDLVAALSPCPIIKHTIVIPIEEIEAW